MNIFQPASGGWKQNREKDWSWLHSCPLFCMSNFYPISYPHGQHHVRSYESTPGGVPFTPGTL